MFLLYIDLLGVKARWQTGRDAAVQTLHQFDGFVVAGLADSGVAPVAGGIDSDAAAFVLDTPGDALRLGRSIYLHAFMHGHPVNDERFWIRGVVLESPDADLRSDEALPDPYGSFRRAVHSDALLDAICVEASGDLKGMRMIIAEDLCGAELREEFRISVNHGWFIPFRRFDRTTYPGEGWWDFAWMVPDDMAIWEERQARMRDRMRGAGTDRLELEQAAHTRVVFDQVGAMLFVQHFMTR